MSQKSYDGSPTVYLIPTPIGNLDDITLRAIDVLKKVEVIFSEDTRVTSLLLNHLQIKKKLVSSHNYNESKNIDKFLDYLKSGYDVGIVTDRGTPIISDPGYELVKVAIYNNYNVVGLPGPTALIPALITSGLSPQPFLFYGFLNSKESKRADELEELKDYPFTMIFYESPHRIDKMLNTMLEVFGDRNISISREISKKFEEIIRGKITEIVGQLVDIKGELVIVVSGENKKKQYNNDFTITQHIEYFMNLGNNLKDSMKKVAKLRGMSKSDVYKEYHRGESDEINSGLR